MGCLDVLILIDDMGTEGRLGPCGRVFLNGLPEVCLDVRSCSVEEYPLLGFAISNGVRRYFALPLFDPFAHKCIGVLEVVDSGLENDFCKLAKDLKESSETSIGLGEQFDEIKNALKVACDKYQLPYAQTWVQIAESSGRVKVKNAGVSYILDGTAREFAEACSICYIQIGKGVVGKAFQTKGACFCEDIKQFSISEYSLVPSARKCGLKGCFAICLHYLYSGDYVYIIEFFLPCNGIGAGDPRTSIEMLLTTLDQQLKNFKVASEQYLGENLSVDVIDPSSADMLHKFEICQFGGTGSRSYPDDAIQNAEPNPINAPCGEMEPFDNVWNSIVLDESMNNSAAQNIVGMVQSNFNSNRFVAMVQSDVNSNLLQSGERTMEVASVLSGNLHTEDIGTFSMDHGGAPKVLSIAGHLNQVDIVSNNQEPSVSRTAPLRDTGKAPVAEVSDFDQPFKGHHLKQLGKQCLQLPAPGKLQSGIGLGNSLHHEVPDVQLEASKLLQSLIEESNSGRIKLVPLINKLLEHMRSDRKEQSMDYIVMSMALKIIVGRHSVDASEDSLLGKVTLEKESAPSLDGKKLGECNVHASGFSLHDPSSSRRYSYQASASNIGASESLNITTAMLSALSQLFVQNNGTADRTAGGSKTKGELARKYRITKDDIKQHFGKKTRSQLTEHYSKSGREVSKSTMVRILSDLGFTYWPRCRGKKGKV